MTTFTDGKQAPAESLIEIDLPVSCPDGPASGLSVPARYHFNLTDGDSIIRDEEGIEKPDEFIIDRARPRTHISFGFGIHRCIGMRLAELQLKIIWEEIFKRFDRIDVVEEPKRVYSSFIKGYETLPVRIAA